MRTRQRKVNGSARTPTPRANRAREMGHLSWMLPALLMISCLALAQDKSAARSDASGHYEGTAKGKTEEVVDVVMDLTEKDGVMSGMIHSTHGDFQITGGSHKGEDISLQFDAQGEPGTIVLKINADKLSGTWSAGDDGGSVEVKRTAAKDTPKEKSS